MWWDEAVFYQIYPLGFCGAPFENDGIETNRILKVVDWIPHIKKLGVNAIYFSPIFESDTHGYNTRDYFKVDKRLGSNKDFKEVCEALHKEGIKVVLDGVFNHVGRGFWAFKDVLEKREASPYVSWFSRIAFDGNSNYNDGLWYEGWEGNYDLVKLNLRNEDVINHIFSAIRYWVEEFDIDGLRLDVAYCLDPDFIKRLRRFCDDLKPEFFLLGETLFGDYNRLMNDEMLHSVTNYECYKGLHSSFNSMNMFEINHSLLRQFGPEQWTLYKGKRLLSFVDNHDVTRVSSILNNGNHLPLIYALAFGMPGIPCVYYGSEWGAEGRKEDGDPALRPCFENYEENELFTFISKLSEAKKGSKALNYGDFKSVVLTNRQCVFSRQWEEEKVYVCINADENDFFAGFDVGSNRVKDLITGEEYDFNGGISLSAYSALFLIPCK
ncbi:MAG: cyclomaltodextrinase [Acetatifactor sp.]|nr:cyclomaltodextrinase [Acetatifactor sp.]